MKTFFKILSSLLLLFNGAGAIYGGLNLILHPDGSSIELSPDWLQHTPFQNYLIPGIVLFVANGLSSMLVFMALILKYRNYAWLVTAQGTILSGWILIQVLLIQTVYFLHIIMGSAGIALILLGILELKSERKEKTGLYAGHRDERK